MITNSFSMSDTGFVAQRYMRLYSYFPYLFSHDIENVLQISYGVGNTAESVIMLPDMKHFDVVDMSPDILEMSHIVHDGTGFYPLRDKRTDAHVEDGRFFLQITKNKYDLITAEPPPPKHAGVINLYTQEYFQLIRNALTPKGVVTYWLPSHMLDEVESLSIIKAFCNVFNDCSLWDGAALNFMLVGSKSGLEAVNSEQLEKRWGSTMRSEFSKIGFDTPEQVFATYVGDREYLDGLTVYAKPLTDNYPNLVKPSRSRVHSGETGLYSNFLDINRRRKSFLNSTYVQKLFPGELTSVIANEFTREGIVTALIKKEYAFVLLDNDSNYWDMVFERMSHKERDFMLLLYLDLMSLNLEIFDEVSSLEENKKSYHYEYIIYLFLEKKYEMLESEVNRFLIENTDRKKLSYMAYRFYLLSKIYQNTAIKKDVLKSVELAKELPKYNFNDWAMKKVLAE